MQCYDDLCTFKPFARLWMESFGSSCTDWFTHSMDSYVLDDLGRPNFVFPVLKRSLQLLNPFTKEGYTWHIILVMQTMMTDKFSLCYSWRIIVFVKLSHTERPILRNAPLQKIFLVFHTIDKFRLHDKLIEYKLSFKTPCIFIFKTFEAVNFFKSISIFSPYIKK